MQQNTVDFHPSQKKKEGLKEVLQESLKSEEKKEEKGEIAPGETVYFKQ